MNAVVFVAPQGSASATGSSWRSARVWCEYQWSCHWTLLVLDVQHLWTQITLKATTYAYKIYARQVLNSAISCVRQFVLAANSVCIVWYLLW